MTKQREAIQDCLRDAGRPLSPQELLECAQQEVPGLGLATVYRTIKLMTEDGVAVAVNLPGESTRYEHQRAAAHHHHHFRCESCEKIYDIPGCVPGIGELMPAGFTMRSHEMTFYGTCPACNAASSN